MRAVKAQPCVNPVRGRLISLLMLRSPWETSLGGTLQPPCTLLLLQPGAVPWVGGNRGAGGLLRTPLSLCPRGSAPVGTPQQLPCGWGLPPCSRSRGTGVGRLCVRGAGGPGVRAASLQDTQPVSGRAGCVPGQQTVAKVSLWRGSKHSRWLEQSVPV